MKNVKIIIENNFIKEISYSDIIEIIRNNEYYCYENCEILPGLVDSHCHVWGLGLINSGYDISGGKDAQQTLEIAKNNNFMRGSWITGRGWNNEQWVNAAMPEKYQADKFFADIPMALTRVDGHAIWCNSKALEIAGINESSQNPVGGTIMKDEAGKPNGILVDNAMLFVERLIPEYTEKQIEDFIIKGLEIALSSGLSAVCDMDVSPKMVNIYQRLNVEGRLPIRVYAFISAQNNEVFEAGILPLKSEMFSIQGIKLYADGALGSYGASLINDYSDKSGTSGLLLINTEGMLKKMIPAVKAGFDIAVHAIGDNANKVVLDSFQKLRELKNDLGVNLRIEHAQILAPEDTERFRELNVVASVQPIHFVSDFEMALKRLGTKRLTESGYLWESLIEKNVLLAAGSDFPIESHNPFSGVSAFITRKNNSNISDEFLNEKISYEQAIDCYSRNAYKALGIDNIGRIENNHKADFVIFEHADDISQPNIKAVFVNGNKAK